MGTEERALRSLPVKPFHNLVLDFVPSRVGQVIRRAALPGPAPHPQPRPSSHRDSPTPWKNTKGKTPSSRSSSRSLSIAVWRCRGWKVQKWLEQGSRVPREGEDRPRLCAGERRPRTLDRAALGRGPELPFTHLPVGVSQPSGPRKCSHRTNPLGHLQGCYPVGLEAVVVLDTPCLAASQRSFLCWDDA